MPAVLEVDVITVVRTWFLTQLAGTKIVTELPGNLADVLPLLQLLRVGGGDDGYVLDSPTLALHGFAGSEQAANALLLQAGTALRAARGVVVAGAVITRVSKLGGPSWAPYTNTALRHAVSLYQLRIKAT